ncbi:DUF262 domain-containing protein [Marinovum sp. 2_MG-2023]|uniref:DUF262 domain-containing protein n=1 Tax=unclassified Marinovum TaxID=2647166 RepID=UPI0026E14BC8|nr:MULTISPECIES: DUF262 domain-containing protein [unclassified Marinovum]MDO6732885.1 DUF262 domain-containing protein [Marinovum sp. 2_MG-2023]MDO6782166.1 DUF262 domain-containing protein [Marinovum sp. 1_MG-2023]
MATGSENYLNLVKQAFKGELKLPAFQRDFKWNRKQVVLLYDSIRQAYPLGSVIFLEGSKQELKEREFKGASESASDLDTKQLVLDGQQRLTAGIDLFYGETQESRSQYFIDLQKLEAAIIEAAVDLDDEDAVEEFVRDLDTDTGYCVARRRVDDQFSLLVKKHLLSTVLLRPDNSKNRDYWVEVYEQTYPTKKTLIRNLVKPHFVVHQAPDIPFVSIDSKLQLDAISRIFATLNSTGKVLTPFELVVAVLFASNIDIRDDLAVLREVYPKLAKMDKTGEIILQTVVLLNQGNHKKSMLPKSISAEDWERDKDKAGRLLNQVGDFLTDHLGMALDKTDALVPYDSIFVPMAVLFDQIKYSEMPAKTRGQVNQKLMKWVVGSALSQRYQEGVHTKQSRDFESISTWIEKDDQDFAPAWLEEVSIPALRSVSPQGAIANLLRCLVNREKLEDPLTGDNVGFGMPNTNAHHIFPKKYVEKLAGWDATKGDKVDLALNLMQLSAETNSRFLNDDPCLQVKDAENSCGREKTERMFAKQGVLPEALAIMTKENKGRDDYWNFIKLRETYFEGLLKEFGFENNSHHEVYDDMEEA